MDFTSDFVCLVLVSSKACVVDSCGTVWFCDGCGTSAGTGSLFEFGRGAVPLLPGLAVWSRTRSFTDSRLPVDRDCDLDGAGDVCFEDLLVCFENDLVDCFEKNPGLEEDGASATFWSCGRDVLLLLVLPPLPEGAWGSLDLHIFSANFFAMKTGVPIGVSLHRRAWCAFWEAGSGSGLCVPGTRGV